MKKAGILTGWLRIFRSASSVVLVVLCAVVLTFGAMFYIWQRYQYVRLGFEVNRLRIEKTRLAQAIEPLEVEVAYLSRLERVDQLAREELGMLPPRPAQVIVLESEKEDPDVPAAAPAQ